MRGLVSSCDDVRVIFELKTLLGRLHSIFYCAAAGAKLKEVIALIDLSNEAKNASTLNKQFHLFELLVCNIINYKDEGFADARTCHFLNIQSKSVRFLIPSTY